MIPADVKANKNNKKRSGGCTLQFFMRRTFKTRNAM